ncbi:MAG: YbgC/FadM family acyl-CoA thioesterase, partial [Alphaproteobacteria bacterium]
MRDGGGICSGALEGDVHRFPVRVYYEDTDAGGVVYYANYLKFAERARTEMMHLVGAGYGDAVRAGKVAFAVRRCEIDFLAPARLDDLLEVETRLLEAGGASLSAEQRIRREGDEI